MMKNISKKKRWAIAMALAAGTILPPFSGAVSAADKEIATNGSAPEAGGSADTGSTATVEGNTLTLKSGVTYTGQLYGGLHLGTGDVKNNILKIENSATLKAEGFGGFVLGGALFNKGSAIENHLIVDGGTIGEAPPPDTNRKKIYGGATQALEGSAIDNDVEIKRGTINGSVFGGALTNAGATGTAKGNKVTLRGTQTTTKVTGEVAGGYSANGTGRVDNNHVVIEGGKVEGPVFGGKTDGSGNVIGNTVTMKGDSEAAAVVGGYGDKTTGEVKGNKVTLQGGKVTGDVAGGVVETNGTGTATKNEVLVTGGEVTGAVYGSSTSGGGKATDNTVTITGGKLHDVYGGFTDAAASETTGNTVNLGDGEHAMAAGYQIGKISGGNHADVTGNTLNVKTHVEAKNIENFETIRFHKNASITNATPLLSLTGGAGTTIKSLQKIEMVGDFLGKYTLLQNANGITISESGNRHAVTKEKTEHILQKDGSGHKILYEGYQFKDAEVTHNANVTGDLYGGRSELGNSTVGNRLTITGGAITGSVHGGYTKTPGTEAGSDKGDSRQNTVTLKNGTVSASVFGGYVFGGTGQVTGNKARIEGGTVTGFVVGGQNDGTGSAKDNEVTVEGGSVHEIIGGLASSGDASENTVDLGAVSVNGNVTGGKSSGAGKTNNNTIHLRGTTVSGIVRGGSNANGTGNTLVVHSRAGGSTIGDFSGIQNLHFYLENDAVSATSPMLRLSDVNAKNITGIGIGVGVSGAAKVLAVGESIRLLQTASGPGLTTDAAIQNQITGDHGSSVRYKFDIKKAPGDPTALIATVKEKEMKEQTKSYVETRAALTDFVNHGGDILAGESLSSAKRAAKSAQGNADMERYQVWAGMGGSALRAESGSHVDTNGWNLHVGWARQDTTKSGQTLFSPFVEYGRGSYDSYVDDNAHTTVHGSGTVSYFGLGLLARAERKGGLWYEGSIRGGRATSDYQSRLDSKDITYDGSNPYYAAHLGLGKDIKVKGEDTVTPYLRYFYTHQNGMTATLSSGEVYDFGSVNSHRIRLGFQYTHKVSESNEFYTGLAYEYEFNGEATATFQGYSTPSPSLKGSSGMLELGYRFTPTDGSLTYDFHFTGWQGIRRGFSGGAQITWGF